MIGEKEAAGDGSESNSIRPSPSPQNKGKGRQATSQHSTSMANRFQASGAMAFNALTGIANTGKQHSGKGNEASHLLGSDDSPRLGEASTPTTRQRELVDTIRTQTSTNNTASQNFANFVEASPRVDMIQSRQDYSDPGPSHVGGQGSADGAAVVQLLDDVTGHDDLDMTLAGNENEAYADGLSLQALNQLREALFVGGSAGMQWDNLLNFSPSFLSQEHPNIVEERASHLGTVDIVEAQNQWYQQWGDVLGAYTDQVWGDLGPLVAEARLEVDQLEAATIAGSRKPEMKALDRLRMVLAHVRGH